MQALPSKALKAQGGDGAPAARRAVSARVARDRQPFADIVAFARVCRKPPSEMPTITLGSGAMHRLETSHDRLRRGRSTCSRCSRSSCRSSRLDLHWQGLRREIG